MGGEIATSQPDLSTIVLSKAELLLLLSYIPLGFFVAFYK